MIKDLVKIIKKKYHRIMVSLIAAVSKNNVIGKNNCIPWNVPEDLEFFKKTTTGSVLILGRKTFESIGRVLPERVFIILSKKSVIFPEGVFHAVSFDNALKIGKQLCQNREKKEIFIAGGEAVFSEALAADCVERIYLTRFNFEIPGGDRFFPDFDRNKFLEETVYRSKGNIPFSVNLYSRLGSYT